MRRNRTTTLLMVLAIAAFSSALVRAVSPQAQATAELTPEKKKVRIARGGHLVETMGCNDCHTPLKMGPRGPEPDMSRALTGHPAEVVMPPAPGPTGLWGWHGSLTGTAFAGPWGVSYAANLTPDPETGLGKWTEEMFIATMKTRRHQGKGRELLPPMPAQILAALDDEEIRSVFAYLQSLAPVKNRVPAPVDPTEPEEKK